MQKFSMLGIMGAEAKNVGLRQTKMLSHLNDSFLAIIFFKKRNSQN